MPRASADAAGGRRSGSGSQRVFSIRSAWWKRRQWRSQRALGQILEVEILPKPRDDVRKLAFVEHDAIPCRHGAMRRSLDLHDAVLNPVALNPTALLQASNAVDEDFGSTTPTLLPGDYILRADLRTTTRIGSVNWATLAV